jgi:hypothetical protein
MDAKLKLLFMSYFFFLLAVLSFLLAGLQHFVSICAGNGLINLRQGYGLLFKNMVFSCTRSSISFPFGKTIE